MSVSRLQRVRRVTDARYAYAVKELAQGVGVHPEGVGDVTGGRGAIGLQPQRLIARAVGQPGVGREHAQHRRRAGGHPQQAVDAAQDRRMRVRAVDDHDQGLDLRLRREDLRAADRVRTQRRPSERAGERDQRVVRGCVDADRADPLGEGRRAQPAGRRRPTRARPAAHAEGRTPPRPEGPQRLAQPRAGAGMGRGGIQRGEGARVQPRALVLHGSPAGPGERREHLEGGRALARIRRQHVVEVPLDDRVRRGDRDGGVGALAAGWRDTVEDGVDHRAEPEDVAGDAGGRAALRELGGEVARIEGASAREGRQEALTARVFGVDDGELQRPVHEPRRMQPGDRTGHATRQPQARTRMGGQAVDETSALDVAGDERKARGLGADPAQGRQQVGEGRMPGGPPGAAQKPRELRTSDRLEEVAVARDAIHQIHDAALVGDDLAPDAQPGHFGPWSQASLLHRPPGRSGFGRSRHLHGRNKSEPLQFLDALHHGRSKMFFSFVFFSFG